MKTIILLILFLIAVSGIESARAQNKIGVLLPLMKNSPENEDRKTGELILKGIKDEITDYKSSGLSNQNIELIIEDTKRDNNVTLELINKLGSDKDVIAIFGPIYSSELVNNTGAAEFHKIPIITPTATSNELAKNNPYVFQLNPVYDTRGRLIAKYSIKELGMTNFIVLSESSYGKLYADSFIDEVSNNKGSIKGQEYYNKENPDFGTHIENLKAQILAEDEFIDFGNIDKAGLDKIRKRQAAFYNIDSLVQHSIAVSIYKLFGKNGKTVVDSLKLNALKITDKAKKIIPGKVDAIYMPISGSDEIASLLTEIELSGLILTLLGTSDWNNEKALDENKAKFKSLYIESDFYLSDLSNEYLSEINEEDYKNFYFGYDGMKTILDLISKGMNTREKLNESLETLSNYKTNHNLISIKNRSNASLNILKFTDSGLVKITDYVY